MNPWDRFLNWVGWSSSSKKIALLNREADSQLAKILGLHKQNLSLHKENDRLFKENLKLMGFPADKKGNDSEGPL